MTSKRSLMDSNPPGEYYCPSCERTYASGERCPSDGTRLIRLKIAIDPMLGRELDGKYTILEKLGQGGMGAVYRGTQKSVAREVAIKCVSPHLVTDPDVIKRFLREAKLASRLAHPNAVAVIDFDQTEDGVFYLVMELVVGRTLDQVLTDEGVFRPERIVRIATQICDALEGAHALQIVHRDLKPANIMLLSQGRDLVKVLDFGLAKSVAPDQAVTTMTNAGALLGTPAYMPPELALGQPCDGRADLYSLGCILYLLASGRQPFVSDSAHELIALHATERAPALVGVPAPLAQVIAQLLEKDPGRRPQTAAATREALEGALEGRLSTPPPWESAPSITPPSSVRPLRPHSVPAPTPAGELSATELQPFVRVDASQGAAPVARRARLWPLALFAASVIAGVGVALSMRHSADRTVAAPAGEPQAAPAPAVEPQAAPAPAGSSQPAPAPPASDEHAAPPAADDHAALPKPDEIELPAHDDHEAPAVRTVAPSHRKPLRTGPSHPHRGAAETPRGKTEPKATPGKTQPEGPEAPPF